MVADRRALHVAHVGHDARLEVVSGSRVAVVAAGAELAVVADRGGGGGDLAESAVVSGSRVRWSPSCTGTR